MEDPQEGENQHHFQPHHPDTPNAYHVPVTSGEPPAVPPSTPAVVTPSASTIQNPVTADQSHNTHDGSHILQWLTFMFWGLSVLALAALTTSVFQRLIVGTDTSTFNYYMIASLVILLPLAFVCDTIYARQEPEKKIGASSRIMAGYTIIFALFGIVALLSVAWNIVSWATGVGVDHNGSKADIISGLFMFVYYLATFIRTLNPTHIRRLAKMFRYGIVGITIIFMVLGFTKPTFQHTSPTSANSHGEQLNVKGARRPAQYVHICTTSNNITYVTQGSPKCLGNDSFQSDYDPSVPGLLYSSPCKTTSGSLRYVYIAESEKCPDNTKLVFYNNVCPTNALSSDDCSGQSGSNTPGNSSSNNFGPNGKLEPAVVGGTQCDIPTLNDGSTTGQVAVTGGATCDEAEANIQSANGKNGGNYTANGYACTSTKQGANTQWSSYWNNDFYSYNCTAGSRQVAFNLQTTSQSGPGSRVITN